QSAANAAPLAIRQDVSVTDEIGAVYRLEAHHACQLTVILAAPKRDTGGDLAIQLIPRHVGLMPPVGRDHTTISLGGGVDNCKDRLPGIVRAVADFGHEPIVVCKRAISGRAMRHRLAAGRRRALMCSSP